LPGIDRPPELEDQITILLSRNDPRLKGGAPPFDPEAKKGESVRPRFIQIKNPASVLDKAEGGGIVELGGTPEAEKDSFKALEKRFEGYYAELHADDGKKEVKGKDDKEGSIKTKIRIEAEPGIEFNYVIQVYAICRRAKFEDVNFTTPLE